MKEKNVNSYYVKNADLLAEIIIFKKTGIANNKLGLMLLTIANNYTTKGNFIGYTWKNDMVGDAMLTCLKYLKNFKPERSSNAFAYVTQICKNSFKAHIKEQKKHSAIKDRCYKGYDKLIENDVEKFSNSAIDYEILSTGKKKKNVRKNGKEVRGSS